LKLTRQERFEQEYSQSKGIISLIEDDPKNVVSSVLQCLLAEEEFVENILVEEQSSPIAKQMQAVMVQIYQKQEKQFEYTSVSLRELTKRLPRKKLGPVDQFKQMHSLIYGEKYSPFGLKY
jgi:hypothetical protein